MLSTSFISLAAKYVQPKVIIDTGNILFFINHVDIRFRIDYYNASQYGMCDCIICCNIT